MSKNTVVEIFKHEVLEGVSEYHLMIHVTDSRLTFPEQADCLMAAYRDSLENELAGSVAVFKRIFLSDAANQTSYLQTRHASLWEGFKCCAVKLYKSDIGLLIV